VSEDLRAPAAQAWALAHEAADAAGVELRPLGSIEECDAIIGVMIATWGDQQTVPRELIRALAKSGNAPYGALADGKLVGYVMGWIGVDERDGPHVHSHMLAAVPDRRHRGVGYALKLAQRAQALEQGIGIVRWTFDPLVARNAYFNLHKLGAVADRFERDYYGEMADELNRGDRSDRFEVRWELMRPPGPWPVELEGDPVVLRRRDDGSPERVGDPEAPAAIVEVPADHAALRGSDAPLARAWRDASADAIWACLEAGLVGLAFLRERGAYVFARTPAG
jgi:predicted GNAT superfamily acetyltransferase